MTLDGLLTLIAVIIAAYQVIPRARLLDLQVRFGKTAWIIVACSTLGVLYLQFFDAFTAADLAPM